MSRICVLVSTQQDLDRWSNEGAERAVCLHSDIPEKAILHLKSGDAVTMYRCGPAGIEVYSGSTRSRFVFTADSSCTFYGAGDVEVITGSAEVYGAAVVHLSGGKLKAGPKVPVFLDGCGEVTGGIVVARTNAMPLGPEPEPWADYYGITRGTYEGQETLLVYKSVNGEYRSQYGTLYTPGSNPEALDWEPTPSCGKGLHFSPTPTMALGYGRWREDNRRFLRCAVLLSESVAIVDKIKAKRVVGGCVEVSVTGVEIPHESEPLLSRARRVERYRGEPSATRIGKELGVGRKRAVELAQQLRTEAAG
jgi:hypothetical protein